MASITFHPLASNISRPCAHADSGNYPVEALPVEIDHPQDVGLAVHCRLRDRLPDGPLVQLGVPNHRDVPAIRVRPREHVRPVVLANQRREVRRDRSESDRPCGEVHAVWVFGTAWICLKPVELPHHREIRRIEVAKKVLDSVKHRRRVRLDRDPIARPHEVEVKCGHQSDNRGARRLMPTHLEPVRVGTHVVGMMNEVHGQPQHPVLDLLQHLISVHEAVSVDSRC